MNYEKDYEYIYVCNIELVDHQPIQTDNSMLDDVASFGIRHLDCMGCVQHMDLCKLD